MRMNKEVEFDVNVLKRYHVKWLYETAMLDISISSKIIANNLLELSKYIKRVYRYFIPIPKKLLHNVILVTANLTPRSMFNHMKTILLCWIQGSRVLNISDGTYLDIN